MGQIKKPLLIIVMLFLCTMGLWIAVETGLAASPGDKSDFPRSLESYDDRDMTGIIEILWSRAQEEPFNLAAFLIFLCAIVHTFLASKFMTISHKWEHEHEEKIKQGLADKDSVHYGAGLFHFLGEVEVIFGIWALVLLVTIIEFFDWKTAVSYVAHDVNFVEAMFVVTIMTLAATRPILKLSETVMQKIAGLLGGGLTAWWFTILTLGPILGSFITEPAAMTISALLLSRKFFHLQPTRKFKYATLGLLFVNISVGGTLTHFAAPPVMMVATPWHWDTLHMFTHFGWKAILGILLANGLYFLFFRRELAGMQHDFSVEDLKHRIQTELIKRKDLLAQFEKIGPETSKALAFEETLHRKTAEVVQHIKTRLDKEFLPHLLEKGMDADLVKEAFDKRFKEIELRKTRQLLPGLLPEDQRPLFVDPEWDNRDDPVPAWLIAAHVLFMAWTIVNAHYPELFISGLLFFLGFAQVTAPFQNRIDLKPPLLVGFFLGGLVVHGGVQGWWIEPVLSRLGEIPLMLGATILTAFNDNAAITFLSTLVPEFTESLKYAVVAGAVAGGGLTVIANAPNPAGQSLLKKYFDDAVSPVGLLKGALLPTAIIWLCFAVFQ
mgnify:CR=1 FL=1